VLVMATDLRDTISLLQAALAALQLLADGCRRQPRDLRDCDEYAPDVVRFWLTGGHWNMLESATQGTSTNLDPLSRGSKSDRLALSVRKADLERGTDMALADRLHWHAASKLYRRQGRFKQYLTLREHFVECAGLPQEPREHAIADAICHELIARSLGWYPVEKSA
jgi:hypothetical protein